VGGGQRDWSDLVTTKGHIRGTDIPAKPAGAQIAIVGMACRLPGAGDPDAFWNLILERRNSVREVPAGRWDAQACYDPDAAGQGTACTKWGAFLEDLAHFDADYFRISPREAKSLDPQHRLLLELAVEALEHAGQPVLALEGTRTGVFVGICNSEYATLSGRSDDYSLIDKYFGTGNAISVAAGRIAYALNLNGPAISVDTACSSSLVAVHLAIGSLRSGESDLCLAGGVNVALSPAVGIYFSQLGAVSRSPECRPFDEGADGYVRGEGCAFIVLKRLSDAQRDGDRILAVIRGSAVNSDGRSAGLTAPNMAAQEALIRDAVDDAGVDPCEVAFAEAHGTGTRLGDPIEARALGRVYGAAPGRAAPLWLGAVKANIGHLESAAGIAGLVKAVRALQCARIPPQANFTRANRMIDMAALGLEVPVAPIVWPKERPLAAVSSFGFSGTNAHIILAPAPPVRSRRARRRSATASAQRLILPLSARHPAALKALAGALTERLAGGEDASAVCRGMALRRSHYSHRHCVTGTGAAELIAELARFDGVGRERAGAPDPGPVMVFSGQGGQWAGMGAAIGEWAAARSRIDAIDEHLRRARGWSVWDAMDRPETVDAPRIVTSQMALFAVQVGLTALFSDWGVKPAAVVGHSMGEIAAALAAGMLSDEQATRLCLIRSLALDRVAGSGAMALAEGSDQEILDAIAATGSDVTIAAFNSPADTVVSGRRTAVEAFVTALLERGILARHVDTDGVPGHSPLVGHLRDDFLAALGELCPAPGAVPVYSPVHGGRVEGRDLGSEYWGGNLCEPVRFHRAISALIEDGYCDFIEVGPRPVLLSALRKSVAAAGKGGHVLGSMAPIKAGRPHSPLATLAALYSAGHDLDWTRIVPEGDWSPTTPYPWQRKYHWITELRGQDGEAAAIRPAPPVAKDDPCNPVLLDRLIQRHDHFGLRSLNMRHLAPRVWLTEEDEAAFWIANHGKTYLIWAMLGVSDVCRRALRRLCAHVVNRGGVVAVVLPEALLPAFEAPEACSISFGVSHQLDLRGFDPDLPGLRRLRSRLARYREAPERETIRIQDTEARTDARVAEIIRNWSAAKGGVPAAEKLLAEISTGQLPSYRRLYAARAHGQTYALAALTAFGAGDGWLLDMEFHDGGTPPGCTERMITEIAFQLAAEGAGILSLGGSYRLPLPPGGDLPALVDDAFRRQLQFKSKFNPETERLVLLCFGTVDRDAQNDLLELTTGRAAEAPFVSRDLDACLDTAPAGPGAPRHPFLVGPVDLAGPIAIYQTHLSAAHPLLADHRVNGVCVWPAAATIEAVVSAVGEEQPAAGIRLLKVVLENSLFVSDEGSVEIQTHVTRGVGQGREAAVYGRVAGTPDTPWQRLMHCRIETPARAPAPIECPKGMKDVGLDAFYRNLDARGIGYGPAFRALTRLAVAGNGAVTGLIEVQQDLGTGGYRVDPTLLDGALQSLSAAAGDDSGIQMLHSVDEIFIGGRQATQKATVVAAAGSTSALDLLAGDGRVILSMRGLLARPAPDPAKVRITEIRLQPHNVTEAPATVTAPCLVVGRGELAGACRLALERAGSAVSQVEGFAQFARLQNASGCGHVVIVPDADDLSRTSDAMAGVAAMLRGFSGTEALPKVWIVTRAQFPAPRLAATGESGFWGLAQVIQTEHPELWGGIFDFAEGATDAAAKQMAKLIANPAMEAAWILSGTDVAVPRAAARTIVADMVFAPRRDRSYIVTGWSGGIGRALLAWLISRGAGSIVAVARSNGQGGHRTALEAAARSRGCELVFVQGDVAEPAVAAGLAAAGRARAPIGGVFHAAGILRDGLMIGRRAEDFADSLEVKLGGAWKLHEATLDDPLDAFVLFSSAASLFGPPAQGAHAAAAAALDGFARARRAAGRPATSIGWGPWEGIGLAAEQGNDRRLQLLGMRSLGAEEALAAMAALIASETPHAYVAPVDWRVYRETAPNAAARSLFMDMLPAPSSDAPRPAGRQPAGRVALTVESVLDDLVSSAAAALFASEASIDLEASLESNGLDSIMIVEMREAMGERCDIVFPLLEFFRAPDFRSLAGTLTDRARLAQIP